MKITNLNKIVKSTGEVKDIIKKIVSISGFNQSIYLEGPSGIGKSELTIQLAKELDAELIDVRLGQLDTIDLNGIGIPDIENKKAVWTRPEIFPDQNSDKKYLLFLDEFNHATEQVFGAAYQLVLERRMGVHILPKNVLIIGAGNAIDDKGIAFSMPSPLVNRFMKINVVPNSSDWLKYAETENIDWRIMSFIKSNPEYLHKFDANANEDNFPTPRNWVKLNDFSDFFSDYGFMEVILNSLFGFNTMVQFKNHLELISKLPHIEKIINGEKVSNTITDLNSSYAFYMLVKNYINNNIENISDEGFFNIFRYTNIQANKEVMQLLNTDIITLINKKMQTERKERIQFLIFANKDLFKENKEFISKLQNFSKSLA